MDRAAIEALLAGRHITVLATHCGGDVGATFAEKRRVAILLKRRTPTAADTGVAMLGPECWVLMKMAYTQNSGPRT